MSTPFEANAADYGAVANVNTPAQAAANAHAILAAFAAAPRVYLPDGQIFYTQDFAVPTNAKKLFGAATLIPAGTISESGLVNIANTQGFVFEDATIAVPLSMTTLSAVVVGSGSVGTELRRLTLSGEFGVLGGGGASDTLIDHCNVNAYSNRGYYFVG